jgi:hypothetical protein
MVRTSPQGASSASPASPAALLEAGTEKRVLVFGVLSFRRLLFWGRFRGLLADFRPVATYRGRLLAGLGFVLCEEVPGSLPACELWVSVERLVV